MGPSVHGKDCKLSLQIGQRVLRRNYTLRRKLLENPPFELWEADLGAGDGILIKAWPFLKGEPTLVERNLWDRELRTLYRLASTPDAQRYLVTLADAAVDREAEAFILALKVPGFDRLSDVLAARRRYSWLSDLGDIGKRAALWRAALGLVEGRAHVHRFRSVHRAVTPDNIFLDGALGPTSLRLGGFEWSVRLGEPVQDRVSLSSPLGRANASLNADWKALGVVLARLFGAAEEAVTSPDVARATLSIQDLPRLTHDEKGYLGALVRANGSGPLDSSDQVQGCRKIIEALEDRESLRISDRLGVTVALRDTIGPTALAVRIAQTDNAVSATDEEALRRWIEDDLADAEIVTVGAADRMMNGVCS